MTTICKRMAAGEYLAVICRDIGVGLRTVYDWADADEAIAARLARAREEGEETIAAGALHELDRPAEMTETKFGTQVDAGDVALRKLRFEGKLKMLAIWNRKKWGEKQQHEHSGKVTLEALVSGTEAGE